MPCQAIQSDSAPVADAAVESVVPHWVRYTATLDASDPSNGSTAEVTFSLYATKDSTQPLWSEKQQVTLDANGKYTVLLGSASATGLPKDLFADGAPRWVAASVDGTEQPRTLLTAAAYALKASDAETLGGHPLSDFTLRTPKGDSTLTPITQINTSSGVLGGGTGPTVNLTLDTNYLTQLGNGAYAQINAANTFKGNQTINGNLTVNGTLSGSGVVGSLIAGGGVDITKNGSAYTIALDATQASSFGNGYWAQLNGTNTFSGTSNTFSTPVSLNSNLVQSVNAYGTYAAYVTNTATGVGGALVANGPSNGIYATASASTTSASGVYGGSAYGYGVQGVSNVSTGQAGVYAEMGSVSGTFSSAKPRAALLVDGGSAGFTGLYSAADNASSAVLQNNSSGSATAVIKNAANSGIGLTVNTPQTSGANGTGIQGSGGSVGVEGGSAYGYGLQGFTGTSGTAGALAQYGGESSARSNYGAIQSGLIADGGPSHVGMFGFSDSSSAAIFTSSSSNVPTVSINNQGDEHALSLTNSDNTSSVATIYAYNKAGGYVAYFANPSGGCEFSGGEIDCTGDINSNTFVTGEDAPHVVRTTAIQASGAWVEDAGSADLTGGRAMIALDQAFQKIADSDIEYQVFLTPGGDCAGLYVAHKKGDSFEVHELNHGTSSLRFDYRILAKRRGKEAQHFEDITEKFNADRKAEERQAHAPAGQTDETPNQP